MCHLRRQKVWIRLLSSADVDMWIVSSFVKVHVIQYNYIYTIYNSMFNVLCQAVEQKIN